MNTTGQRVAKNATVLMASQLTTWLLTLLLTLFLPRFLGARAVGQFHFANSLWAIVAMAVTFGMDRYLTKEIARTAVPDTLNGRSRAAHLFGVTLLARTLLYLLGFGGVALYLALLDYPPETAQVVLVIGVAQLLWQYVSAATAVLQGLEQMQAISIGSIAGKALNTVVAIALLLLGYGVLPVAAVTIGAALANLLVLLHALRRSLPLRPSLHPRAVGHALRASARMLRASATYLFTQLSLVIYMQVDIILISLLVDETTIGWYGAADQLFGTLLFIPTVFMTAVFPALSRLYTTDTGSLQRLTSKSFDLLLLLSVPIGLGLLVVASPAVVLLFGAEFAPSGPVLAVFGIVLILTYQNMLLGQFLVSTDRQSRWTVVMVAATLATIPLDLLLIPWCVARFGNGALGGALAFVVTEAGMTLAGIALLPHGALTRANAWRALRVLLAGLLMLAAAWPLRHAFVALPILAGAVVYPAALWLLRAVDPADARLLLDMAQTVLGRFRRRPAPRQV